MHLVTNNLAKPNFFKTYPVDPVNQILYKFCSIIYSVDKFENICKEERLITWLNKISEFEKGIYLESQYHDCIFPCLNLSNESSLKKIQNRKKIALTYANILDLYVPEQNGDIKQKFNYIQLVVAIKTVFTAHIKKKEALFTGGFRKIVGDCSFYAKIENKQVCIIAKKSQPFNKGSFGCVSEVYDIGRRRLFVLKRALGSDKSVELIKKEIVNLNYIHDKAFLFGLSVEGLQEPPTMVLDFHVDGYDLVGFVGKKYGINLYEWLNQDHSNQERIVICKSLMNAYKNIFTLGYWHGDIKLENVLIEKEGVVIIDWAGAVLFQETAKASLTPGSITNAYIDQKAIISLSSHPKQKRHAFEESCQFIETASSCDLFSTAMVLFMILTSKSPFVCESDDSPDADAGIYPGSLDALIERNYSDDVAYAIIKMLAPDHNKRYSSQEAIDLWEKIG